MPDNIYIGNFAKGLSLNRLPFNIDNDAFPKLFNMYSWRGRAKRKRGTVPLARLQIQVSINSTMPTVWQVPAFALVASAGNLVSQFTLGSSATITPGTINLIVSGDQTYTDPNQDGTLTGSSGGTGIINYSTGAFSVSGSVTGTVTGTFSYFPGLPVMGLVDFDEAPLSQAFQRNLYPVTMGFDTKNSYQIKQTTSLINFYNVNYYKSTNLPFVWSGADYQQFWTTNYSGAMWASNNKPGLNLANVTYVSGSGTSIITFTFVYPSYAGGLAGTPIMNLVVGDVIWFNEFGTGPSGNTSVTGVISTIVNASTGTYAVTFTQNVTVSGTGIGQLLTNSVPGQDGIKWYDGDPTAGTGLPANTGLGWVNYSPPLTVSSSVSLDNNAPGLYYLVGALAIVPFKDRLVFFAPYIQTSSGNPILLQDTALWTWNGTPYYTVSSATKTGNIYNYVASLVPINQTAATIACVVDQTGAGGYQPAGIPQPIATVSANEDVLLVGFGGDGRKTRFVYTGNDLEPFLWFTINSELPSSCTYSAISLDKGVIDLGQYGFAVTDQQSSQRLDLEIPDEIFKIQALNNGAQRVNAIRDFKKEWIYFSYPYDDSFWKFPTQTFLYNYRDNTWGIFYENWTTHGTYRPQNKKSWLTTGFASWIVWREPWNSGVGSPQYPSIIAGNPQGWVLTIGEGTGESPSGTIQSMQASGTNTQINSINHCVNEGDYLYFSGALLDTPITAITQANPAVITTNNAFVAGQYVTINNVLGMTELNGNTYLVLVATGTTLTIQVDSTLFTAYTSGGTVAPLFNTLIGRVVNVGTQNAPLTNSFIVDIAYPNGTYLGLGVYTRLSQPVMLTKQFPFYWEQGRGVRLGVQKYLMDYTQNSQVTVNIYLSQDQTFSYNDPVVNSPPNSLVYSQIMYTCPESSNIGLTSFNSNLQMPTANTQHQIWHRFSTSLQGDSVQIGITLSDAQMRNLTYATNEITLHGIQLTVYPGPQLC